MTIYLVQERSHSPSPCSAARTAALPQADQAPNAPDILKAHHPLDECHLQNADGALPAQVPPRDATRSPGPTRKTIDPDATVSYPIVEIFESLQGEGFNTGMPAIFIRFGECNLACPWCDTDYHTWQRMSLDAVMDRVRGFSARNIIITGGEPTIQPGLEMLLDVLKAEGYYLAIETNGMRPVPPQIDYIATSPKRLYRKAHRKHHIPFAHEVRIVVDGEVRDFCEQIEDSIRAERYYLSPCEDGGQMNLHETITQLGQLNQRPGRPRWQLSIQTHKLIGIE